MTSPTLTEVVRDRLSDLVDAAGQWARKLIDALPDPGQDLQEEKRVAEEAEREAEAAREAFRERQLQASKGRVPAS